MPYATTLTSLEDSRVLPIDQNSARFWGRIAYDDAYGGFALAEDEGRRMAEALGDKPVLFLKNHGVIVTGRSVAHAFDELYYLEKACQQLVLAYSTGRPLRLMSDNLAAQVAGEWDDYEGFAKPISPSSRRCWTTRIPATPREDTAMPKGYWIARVDVHDPDAYRAYIAANGAVFRKFGARFLVRADNGHARRRLRERNVVLEFPNYADALGLYKMPPTTSR